MEVSFIQSKKPETKPAAQPNQPAPAAAAPPVDPPAAAEPQLKIPTPEEMVQQTTDLYSTMGWGEPPKRLPGAETPGQPAAPAAEPAAPPSAPPAAPEPEPEPEPEELTTQELISASARETAREVAKALQPAAAPAPPAEKPVELSPQDERDFRIVQYLERSNPRQYSGLEQRYRDYVKAHYDRIATWNAEHPDTPYDPDAEENKTWYEANIPPELTEDVVDQAKIDMAAEAQVAERLKPIEAERAKEKQEKALEAAGGQIVQQLDRKVLSLVELVDPELAKLVKDDKGNPVLTDANVAKLDEANPIAKEVLDEIVKDQLEPLLFELEKTTVPGLGYRLDPKTNPAHQAIASFLAKKEQDMTNAPARERIDAKGRRWVSLADYSRQMNAIQADSSMGPQERQGQIARLDRTVWTISADQLEDLMVDFYAKKAKAIIEKREVVARKRFKVAAPGATNGAPAPAPAPAPRAGIASPKPNSPSLGGQDAVVTSSHLTQGSAKSFPKEATDVMFGR